MRTNPYFIFNYRVFRQASPIGCDAITTPQSYAVKQSYVSANDRA